MKNSIISSLLALAMCLPTANAFAWGRFDGGVHPARPGNVYARRNPVVVHNVYVDHRPHGCVGCGAGVAAVAGLVGGAIIGAAIVGSAAPAPAPMVVAAPPPQVVYAQAGYGIGTEVAALPPGCVTMNVNGATYYQCGATWFQPYFGGNAVYYTVVPAP